MMESGCDREQLRDFAFDELPAPARAAMERHLAVCEACAAELAQLQLTTAALRVLPDREIPQRIAFVSDKVFQPSPVLRLFSGFWNSGARLAFASACVLAAAIVISAYRRPVEIRALRQPSVAATLSRDELSREMDARIKRAVSDAVARVHHEDAQVMKAALDTADRKADQQRRTLMVAMSEQMNTLQKRLGVLTEYAMAGPERNPGSGQ
jgi:anti-sigma factor RsiW